MTKDDLPRDFVELLAGVDRDRLASLPRLGVRGKPQARAAGHRRETTHLVPPGAKSVDI